MLICTIVLGFKEMHLFSGGTSQLASGTSRHLWRLSAFTAMLHPGSLSGQYLSIHSAILLTTEQPLTINSDILKIKVFWISHAQGNIIIPSCPILQSKNDL